MPHLPRNTLLLVVAQLVLPNLGAAQSPPTGFLPITETRTPLGEELYILRGPASELHTNKIPELFRRGFFERSQNAIPSLGLTDDVVWIAFQLRAGPSKAGHYYLELGYSQLDSITVYGLAQNSMEHLFSAGDSYFFKQRPIVHRHFLFPLELQEEQTNTVFLRIETTGAMQLPLTVWTRGGFWFHDQGRLLLQAIYVGLILVMLIYNLFLYLSTRERVYLYYILSISSIAVMLITLTGLGFQMLWPNTPSFNSVATPLFITLATIFSARFTDDFLSLPSQLPWASRAIRLVSWLAIANLFIIPWAPYPVIIRHSGIVSMFCLAMNLIAGTVCFQRGDRSAGYYMLAWSTFLLGGVSVALNKFGFLTHTPASEYALQVGSALEVILLSFALGHRMNQLEEQNNNATLRRTELRKEMTDHLQSRLHVFSRITSELHKPLAEMHRLLSLLKENMVGAASVVDFLFPGSDGAENQNKSDLKRSIQNRVDHLSILDGAYRHVSQVVRELQGLGIIGGRLQEHVNVAKLLNSALEKAENEHGERNVQKVAITFDKSQAEELPSAFGNPYILGHALSTLVVNAFTHAFDDPQPCVLLSAESTQESVSILVKNNGPCIPVESLPRLFDHSRPIQGNQATSLPVIRTVLQQQGANILLLDSGIQSGWVQFELTFSTTRFDRLVPTGERV